MNIIRGDLIALAKDNYFDVIVHGCNCFNSMGAGIAVTIKNEFPEAYAADLQTVKGDRNKLGTISHAEIDRDGIKLIVVNAYTQYRYNDRGILADYKAIALCMKAIKLNFSGKSIGYPKIGAGLAKGDWQTIAKIIDRELAGENHTLVEYVRSQI